MTRARLKRNLRARAQRRCAKRRHSLGAQRPAVEPRRVPRRRWRSLICRRASLALARRARAQQLLHDSALEDTRSQIYELVHAGQPPRRPAASARGSASSRSTLITTPRAPSNSAKANFETQRETIDIRLLVARRPGPRRQHQRSAPPRNGFARPATKTASCEERKRRWPQRQLQQTQREPRPPPAASSWAAATSPRASSRHPQPRRRQQQHPRSRHEIASGLAARPRPRARRDHQSRRPLHQHQLPHSRQHACGR